MLSRVLMLSSWVFLVAGCGSGSGNDGGAQDMARASDLTMAASDMTVLPIPDMTPPPGSDLGPFSCAATVACTRMCTSGNDNGAMCVANCIKMASADAKIDFDPLQACAGPACTDRMPEMGTPPCDDPSSNACIQCVMANCNQELMTCLMN